jgi:hypothetical protein
MVTRKGKREGIQEKGNEGRYRRGKRNGTKNWENRKWREILEARIDLNNWLQLWDDNPLWVVKNPKYL